MVVETKLLIKNAKKNIDSVSPDVDDPFKSMIETAESIESSNEEFKADKRTIRNSANGNSIVAMH